MMDLDTSQKSPIRYDTIQALKNVSRFDTDPQKVYLDPRYGSKIAIQCTTGSRYDTIHHARFVSRYDPDTEITKCI